MRHLGACQKCSIQGTLLHCWWECKLVWPLQRRVCCWAASVVSDSVRPHRRQPTRLPHPWDSPGKDTGVGCHFPLQFMKVKSESEVAQSCLIPSDPMDCSPPGSSISRGINSGINWVCDHTKISLQSIVFYSGYTLLSTKNFKQKIVIMNRQIILEKGKLYLKF